MRPRGSARCSARLTHIALAGEPFCVLVSVRLFGSGNVVDRRPLAASFGPTFELITRASGRRVHYVGDNFEEIGISIFECIVLCSIVFHGIRCWYSIDEISL